MESLGLPFKCFSSPKLMNIDRTGEEETTNIQWV